ncbi:MAG: protein-disulfide reductase DsbD domain-containing protein [Candidatus Angelobacter sp.]
MAVQHPATQHARVELLSRQDAASPATDLQLGVHFILEPGWHIYWINPGDSGQPPVLKWQLPAGFTAGEIEWPRPERMQPNPQLADFGYHDDVLLPDKVHTASSTVIGSTVRIGVDAKWLICREVCIPEHAQLHLDLPMAATTKLNLQSAQLFARAKKLLPQPLPRGWKASAKSNKDELILTVVAGKRITAAQFFPLDPGQIDNPSPQKIQPSTNGFAMSLKKSELLLKPITVLRGVLAVPGRPAYRIEAPVRQSVQ